MKTRSLVLCLALIWSGAAQAAEYLILDRGQGGSARVDALLARDYVVGLSVAYYWSDLEPELGQYDFSAIDADLARVRAQGKKLFIMVRDKSFPNHPVFPVPQELAAMVVGNAQVGYLAARWEGEVSLAFQNLIRALGARYNDEPDFMGFKTSETAPGMRLSNAAQNKAYINNLVAVIEAMGQAFPDKETFFYMNWGPGGMQAINVWGRAAMANGVGLGGPDIHPDVDMPSYRFFRQMRGRVNIMMDVQYSDYSHGSPAALLRFGEDTLKARYLVWLPYPGVDYDALLAGD